MPNTAAMPRRTELLTTAEVARLLGCDVATVNRWARRGRLVPTQKLPGRNGARLYDPAHIERVKAAA